jgi:LemA protein
MLQPMNGVLLLWPVLAVLVFWGVGMRNRVLRLRQRAQEGFGDLERQLAGYAALVRRLQSVPESMAPWQALQQQALALEAAAKAVRQSQLQMRAVAELRRQLQLLQQQWQAVQQAPADLAGAPVPETVELQWDEVQRKVELASAAYNHLAEQYNAALLERPARWAVRLMGLHKAGRV